MRGGLNDDTSGVWKARCNWQAARRLSGRLVFPVTAAEIIDVFSNSSFCRGPGPEGHNNLTTGCFLWSSPRHSATLTCWWSEMRLLLIKGESDAIPAQ